MAKPKNVFELSGQKAKLVNINGRGEKHGDDKKLAADLKFTMKVSNDILSEFDPSLKSALYKKADDVQGQLDINDKNFLSALKFPNMGAIGWGAEFKGYELYLPYGIDDRSSIKLSDCQVDKFKFAPQDGGTVEVTFRVIVHPTASELGKLFEFIESEVEITLTPPDEEDLKQAA